MLPFFSTSEEIKLYVKDPYPKFEDFKQPEIWAEIIEFAKEFNFSNVLRSAQNAKIIDPKNIFC